MMPQRKKFAPVLAALAVGALVVGCGSSGGDTDTVDDTDTGDTAAPAELSGEVTFVSADTEDAFAPVIAAFNEKYPDVTIDFQNIPFDQYNNIIKQRVGAQDPEIDVLLVDGGAAATWASQGWLADMTEYLTLAEENSVPSSVEQNIWEGKLWALPMWTSSLYLYYNADLLAAAGVEPPNQTDRWTWEQVVEAGKAAQAAGAEWGVLFDQFDRYYQLQPLSESAGGGSGVTGDALDTIDVTNDGWIRAMTWYGDLFASGVSPRGTTTDQMKVMFSAGQAAFFQGGSWSLGAITEADAGFTWGVALNPMFEGGTPAMATGSWSLGVSAYSDNLDAAKAFAEFVSQDVVGNRAVTEVILLTPTNLGAFDNFNARIDEIAPPATEGMGAIVVKELREAAVSRPNVIGFTQLQDVLGRAYADIRNGQPVEATLEAAQAELQGLWDRQ